MSFWTQLVAQYVEFSIKLCRINPAGQTEGFGPPVARRALPAWSRLAELFYYYFSLKLALILVLHHQYSQARFELKQHYHQNHHYYHHHNQQPQHQVGNSGRENDTKTIDGQDGGEDRWRRLEVEVGQLAGHLELLGDAFYGLEFGAEPTLLMTLVIFYLGCQQPRLYVALCGPVRLNVLALLLDPERERALVTERAIGHQVAGFVASRRNFAAARQGQPRASWLGAHAPQEHIVGLVRELELAGHLVPANRRPEWRHRLALLYGLLLIACQISGAALFLVVLFELPQLMVGASEGLGLARTHLGLKGRWFMLELVTYALLCMQSFCFLFISKVTQVYDLACPVRELRLLMSSLMVDIRRLRASQECSVRERSYNSRRGSADEHPRRRHLNKQLIRTLILYKQFLGQLRSSQRFVGFLGAHMALIMLLTPLVDRLYAAHLTRNIRILSLARNLFVILTCDVIILPSCWLHARCLELVRSMSSLLAHIDAHQAQEQETLADCEERREIYDEHTVWLLRREQSVPELGLRRFATRAIFLRLTYANFLGIHFWCGILLVPLMLRDTSHLGASGGAAQSLITGSMRLF